MAEITLDATIENIDPVTDFIDEFLESVMCPMKTVVRINIAVDELFGNIARYAYGDSVGSATVQLEYNEANRSVDITFIDSGVPYNPLELEAPDITLSAEDRKIGGLGIFMVRKTMDDVRYRFEDGKNILTITKVFD